MADFLYETLQKKDSESCKFTVYNSYFCRLMTSTVACTPSLLLAILDEFK